MKDGKMVLIAYHLLESSIGAYYLHQNLGRRTWELEASKIVSIKELIA